MGESESSNGGRIRMSDPWWKTMHANISNILISSLFEMENNNSNLFATARRPICLDQKENGFWSNSSSEDKSHSKLLN